MRKFKALSKIPTPKKLLALIIIIPVAIWAVRYVFFKAKAAIAKVRQKTEVAKAKASGEQSYDDSWYVKSAKIILNALSGWTSQGDKDDIKKELAKLKTNLDLSLLVDAFGTPTPKGSFLVPLTMFFQRPKTLSEWLNEDMGDSMMATINQMLRQKGITTTL